MIRSNSILWTYMTEEQRELASDGQALIDDLSRHPKEALSDYSYLVFPFAKLYEGFLKLLFLDVGFIEQRQYQSDHFRIGKVLSPNLTRRLRDRSVYKHIADRYGKPLADRLWQTWKNGRNRVFHYFPHNYSALSQDEAVTLCHEIVQTMEHAVSLVKPKDTAHTH